MISAIIATAAFLVALEGIVLALFNKQVKKFMAELVRKKKSEDVIRKIGLWEILIGFILLVIAILVRNL